MEFVRPEGCQATVTKNWEAVPDVITAGQYHLTVGIECEQTRSLERSINREFGDFTTERKKESAEAEIAEEISEVLTGMCATCPRNILNHQTSAETS